MSSAERTIALVFPVGLGLAVAVFAIVDQNGYTRGYASVGFLWVIAWIAFALVIAGIVTFHKARDSKTSILMFVAAFTLPATYLFVLYIVRKYYGE